MKRDKECRYYKEKNARCSLCPTCFGITKESAPDGVICREKVSGYECLRYRPVPLEEPVMPDACRHALWVATAKGELALVCQRRSTPDHTSWTLNKECTHGPHGVRLRCYEPPVVQEPRTKAGRAHRMFDNCKNAGRFNVCACVCCFGCPGFVQK